MPVLVSRPVLAAIKARFVARSVGSTTRYYLGDVEEKAAARPWAVFVGVSEQEVGRTNKTLYHDVEFGIEIEADTMLAVDAVGNAIDDALREAPLTLSDTFTLTRVRLNRVEYAKDGIYWIGAMAYTVRVSQVNVKTPAV